MDVNAKIIPFPLSPARTAELLHQILDNAPDVAAGSPAIAADGPAIAAGGPDAVSLHHYKSYRERVSLLKWAKQGKPKRNIAGNA